MINLVNAREYIENFLWIKTKSGDITPFMFNDTQKSMYEALRGQYLEGRPMRVIVLKARQEGVSTLSEALIFQRTATAKGVGSLIVAHREDSTSALYAMSRLFFERLPDRIRPMKRASNAQELVFENPDRDPERKAADPGLHSFIRCVTAGGGAVGRSFTLRNVHASELAFWPGDILETWIGIIQAVPAAPGTLVIVESTAKGFNAFKDMWDAAVAGDNDFLPLFFPWFAHTEYRMPVPEGTQFTDDEREMQERYGLDDGQLYWRRWCIKNNCGGDGRMFRQEYPSNPDEAFLLSGDPVFDNELVMARRQAVEGHVPTLRGEFDFDIVYDASAQFISLTNTRFIEKPNGFVTIYKPPERGHPYIIGGDTAGEGSDWFTGQVIDNSTGEQAAVLRHQFDDDLYARQLYCLGRYYNDAYIAIEANFTTHPITLLQQLRYPHQHVRRRSDTFTGETIESYGWRTDSSTRLPAISGLVSVMRECPELVCDYETLGEMLTFVYDERHRPAALEGKHDDLVMALAIAHAVRPYFRSSVDVPEGRRVKWTKSQWADYRAATKDQRMYLKKIWGEPER